MGWEKFDSRFSGKEASPEIYDKLKNNIMKFHGKQKELLSIYEDLSEENKDKVLQYSKNLLSNQQMEEDLMPNAAHERPHRTLLKNVRTMRACWTESRFIGHLMIYYYAGGVDHEIRCFTG